MFTTVGYEQKVETHCCPAEMESNIASALLNQSIAGETQIVIQRCI